MDEITSEIKRVLRMEAATLAALPRAVDGAYAAAVRAIARCRGKVLVTGVGKSGVIAQKIASTMASTGTPAIHLDPSEAMHGGLGLVSRGDVVIAVGKSGESEELNNLLPRLRGLRTTIIALTANPKSTLAKAATITLHTPVEAEACPHNLAPTCSTTAALAVGDALAVALMKVRGFRRESFAQNHPGGRLGKRLTLTVADIMRSGPDNPVVEQDRSIGQMLTTLTQKQAGAVSVIDKRGKFLGLIADYDIRRCLELGRDIRKLRLRDIMNHKATTVLPTALAAKAVDVMENRKNPFNVLPVVDRAGRAVGMVQIHDVRARGL